jgi:hypothetical protein
MSAKRTIARAPLPEPSLTGVQARDAIDSEADEALGRLAVMERLFELLSANSSPKSRNVVDFCHGREEAFWRGLRAIASRAGDAVETIRAHADQLEPK